jgi:hypothetical protein
MQIEQEVISYFNRYKHMNSEVIDEIHNCTSDLICMDIDTWNLTNWMFGFFDGYDYTEQIIFSRDLALVTHINPELGAKISTICGIIEKYPRSKFPNA